MPTIRYFAQVGSERIELGQDPAKKEDPFKPLQTGGDIDHWAAELTDDAGTRYVAVSHESLRDAVARLAKKLPEDIKPPDTTKHASAGDKVAGRDSVGGPT